MAAKPTFSSLCIYRQLHLTPKSLIQAPCPEIFHTFTVIKGPKLRRRRFTVISPCLVMLVYVCNCQVFKEGSNFQKYGNIYTWKELSEDGASNEISLISTSLVVLERLASQAEAVHMLLQISELARLGTLISRAARDRRELFLADFFGCPSTNFPPNLVPIGTVLVELSIIFT